MLQKSVLFFNRPSKLGFENFWTKKIDDLNSTTGDFVFVGRADSANGGADLSAAAFFFRAMLFAQAIDQAVIGKDDVRSFADMNTLVRGSGIQNPASDQRVDFLKEDVRIEDDAICDHAGFARVKNAAWN